eukprot:scaffold38203_cov32-Tisochrysis_lutea.AAC.8
MAPSLPTSTFKYMPGSPQAAAIASHSESKCSATPRRRKSEATHKLNTTGCGVVASETPHAAAFSAQSSAKPTTRPVSTSSATSCWCRHQSHGVILRSRSRASRPRARRTSHTLRSAAFAAKLVSRSCAMCQISARRASRTWWTELVARVDSTAASQPVARSISPNAAACLIPQGGRGEGRG